MTGAAPKVSVCIVTYNHAAFIEACLTSLLTQETDFDFEIVVGDDCSTDATPEILARLSRDHPGRLRVIRRERNLGPTGNLLATHNAARGAYVASLDGDDLAFPGKLARQAAVLDREPALAACGHRMAIVDEAGTPTGPVYPARLAAVFDIGKVIRCGMPVLASSIMYRAAARALADFPGELFDWYLLTDIMKAGPAGFIGETLGAYRVNRGSLTGQMRMAAMQARMLGLYEDRLTELPGRRADVFAHAVFMTLVALRMGLPVTAAHRRLLAASFSPLALAELADAARWAIENRAAMKR